jgi:hypothetical protein
MEATDSLTVQWNDVVHIMLDTSQLSLPNTRTVDHGDGVPIGPDRKSMSNPARRRQLRAQSQHGAVQLFSAVFRAVHFLFFQNLGDLPARCPVGGERPASVASSKKAIPAKKHFIREETLAARTAFIIHGAYL